ncbi:MAG: hypothetical protein ACO3CH_06130 [Ilumatobacteraceae bacterium]
MEVSKTESKLSFAQVREVQKVEADSCRTRHAVFSECPHCGSALHAEHAHFKCSGCGWRDSCCD